MKKILCGILIICTIVLSLSACDSSGAKGDGPEELVTLTSKDIVVNEDGSFVLEGKMNNLGTSLKIGSARLITTMDADKGFSTSVQMGDPVDSAVLIATYLLSEQEISLTFDTTRYTAAIKAAQEAEQLKLEQETTLKAFAGASLADAMAGIKTLGYTPSFYYGTSELECTGEVLSGGELWQSGWVATKVDSIDVENKTVKIYLRTQESIDAREEQTKIRATLEEKLEPGNAWQAALEYGKIQYPYGFKIHDILGKIAEQAEDENTWFLKAECTVTNEYNAKAKLTCEVRVTGTSDNPEVIYFIVY